MTDTSIARILLKDNFKDIYDALEKSEGSLYLNNAINKWLLSIFTQGISEIYTYFIWDLFLLEGNVIIFKTIYAMIIILEKDIIKCKSFEELNNILNEIPLTFNKRGKLAYYLISKKFNFNMDMIKNYRKILTPSIIKEVINIGTFQNIGDEDDSSNNKKTIICDLDWPLCLKDKKDLKKEYDHIVLKQLNEPNIIDNYIDNYEEYQHLKKNINSNRESEEELLKEKKYEDLLIERKKHLCRSKIMSIRESLIKSNNFAKIKSSDIKARKLSSEFYNKDFNYNENALKRNMTINQIIIDVANDNEGKISFIKENIENEFLKDY